MQADARRGAANASASTSAGASFGGGQP
jgi:hypothetical protein